MPQSKKKTTKKKRTRASRASWSEGERRIDRLAREAGVKPVYDFDALPHVSPKDGEELLSAIHEMREAERQAVAEKETPKRKRTPRRA
ncbi:MAG: hypothetical protein KIT58_05605 [Planctomycetota bacterium]|nr:hypothetical protein [Planctomycetota bacterium]